MITNICLNITIFFSSFAFSSRECLIQNSYKKGIKFNPKRNNRMRCRRRYGL